MKLNIGIGLLFCLTAVSAFYTGSDVVELDPNNWNTKVMQDDALWIVEFYAPWCGHCQALTPEWKKAAKALKGVVKVGAVDADANQNLGSQYGVQGFPTIKFFGANKYKPEDYQGGRTASAIVEGSISKLRTMVNERLSGKSGGSGGGKKQGSQADVVELTDSNFEKEVLGSDQMVLVEFFAPWCGHCKNLAPHWAQAATELKGKVKVCALDATVHQSTAGKYGVRGYPTIKMFPAGKKDGEAVDYDGGRTANDIVAWAMDRFEEDIPPPEINELVTDEVLKDACENYQLCVISILPHILDCQSKCRNDYIKVLKALADKYKKRKWGWVWAEAGAQLDVEEAFGIGGFGYPAMAAMNSRKMKFALLRGSFSETGINEFLRELAVGRGRTEPVKNAKIPPVKKTEAWDGKDGKLPVEEDIDLSDVNLDDTKDEL